MTKHFDDCIIMGKVVCGKPVWLWTPWGLPKQLLRKTMWTLWRLCIKAADRRYNNDCNVTPITLEHWSGWDYKTASIIMIGVNVYVNEELCSGCIQGYASVVFLCFTPRKYSCVCYLAFYTILHAMMHITVCPTFNVLQVWKVICEHIQTHVPRKCFLAQYLGTSAEDLSMRNFQILSLRTALDVVKVENVYFERLKGHYIYHDYFSEQTKRQSMWDWCDRGEFPKLQIRCWEPLLVPDVHRYVLYV